MLRLETIDCVRKRERIYTKHSHSATHRHLPNNVLVSAFVFMKIFMKSAVSRSTISILMVIRHLIVF